MRGRGAAAPSASRRPRVVKQAGLVAGRIALGEPPIHVNGKALPRGSGIGALGTGGAGAAILQGQNEDRSKDRSRQEENGLVAPRKPKTDM